MENKHCIHILQIHDRESLTPQENKILLDLIHHGNNIQFGIMLLSTETKTKKRLDCDEYLVYFQSSIKLPSIDTELISVISNQDDTQKYKQLNSDNYYHLIGIPRIKQLTIMESRYLVDLLNRIPSILSEKYTPKSTA